MEYHESRMFEVRVRTSGISITTVSNGYRLTADQQKRQITVKHQGFQQRMIPGSGTAFLDGELFAADAGEWGGALTFLPKNSRQPVVVLQENVQAVGVIGPNAYVLTGLEHMNISETRIYKVTRSSGKWQVVPVAVPPEVPRFGSWVGDHFVYAGDIQEVDHGNYRSSSPTSVKSLALNGEAIMIAKFDCNQFDIRSMVQTRDGIIWFGGLGFVAAVRPGGKPTFFVPLTGSKPRTGKGRTK